MGAVPNPPPELKAIFEDIYRQLRDLQANANVGGGGGTLAGVGGNEQAGTAPVVTPDGTVVWTSVVEPSDLDGLVGLPADQPGLRSLAEIARYINYVPYAPLTITTGSLPAATNGTAYSQTLAATGGSGTYTWSSTTLPTGLSLNASTGAITGTPTVSGTTDVTFTVADNARSVPATAIIAIVVNAAGAPLTFTLPTETPTLAQAFSLDLSAFVTGGTAPYTYTSYTSSTVGSVSSSVAYGTFYATNLSIANGTAIAFSNISTLSGITNGTLYYVVNSTPGSGGALGALQISATVGGTPITPTGTDQSNLVIHFPTLPNHALSLSGHTISGTPTGSPNQTLSVSVSVTDSAGSPATVTSTATWTLQPSLAVAVTTSSLPPGQVGVAYPSASLAATGGTPAYTWSIATGTLPAGLSLNTSTGAITGTPTAAGTSTLVFKVTDSTSPTPETDTSNSIDIVIATASAPLAFTLPPESPTLGTPFSLDVSQFVTGGTAPYTYTSNNSAGSPSLPHYALNISGSTISGTPAGGTAGTTFNVSVTVKDSSNPQQVVVSSAVWTLQSVQNWPYAQRNIASVVTPNSQSAAAANTAAINAAIAAMAAATPHQGRIYYDDGAGTFASPTVVWVSGSIGSVATASTPALNQWDLGNCLLRWTKQAMFAEGGAASMVHVGSLSAASSPKSGASDLRMTIQLDGNGVNQWATDMTRIPSATSNRWGFYGDGLALYECGFGSGSQVVANVYNMRGVTGSSHNTYHGVLSGCAISGSTITSPTAVTGIFNSSGTLKGTPDTRVAGAGIPANTFITAVSSDHKTLTVNHACTAGTNVAVRVGVDNIECFDVVIHGGHGGDDLVIVNKGIDGSYPALTDDNGAPYCSGIKFHYTQQAGGNSTVPPMSFLTFNADNRRHGAGCYAGGQLTIRKTSSANNCGHGMNFEQGVASGSQYNTAHGGTGCHSTWNVVVGDSTDNSYSQVVTTNCGIGLQLNANQGGGAGDAPLVSLNAYGWTSGNTSGGGDTVAFETDGGTPPTAMNLFANKIVSPTQVAVKFNGPSATAAGNFTVAAHGPNVSEIHLGGATKIQPASVAGAITGTWTNI